MKRLAIVSTHPIQYNAPLFRLLSERSNIAVKVFYTWGEGVLHNKYDPGFEKAINWDIPLLEGYDYAFVKNISQNPGSDHFNGIINPTLIREIGIWGANSILVFGWAFQSHFRVIRYFHKRIPVYFRGDSTLLDDRKGGLKQLFRSIALRWIYRHIDKAFYVGKANKLYFIKNGLKDSQLIFAPHSIDNTRFSARITKVFPYQEIPRETSVTFLFAGKFESKKNPVNLLESFIQLDDPDAYLTMVGNGHLEKELKLIVSDLPEHLRRRIRFVDFQNQSLMPGIYQQADVFVLPSQGPGETWGLSVNEAMAAGCAVLVSDRCGCHLDLVQDGVNGHVFSAYIANDLLDKMKQVMANRSQLKNMKSASIAIINKFSFHRVCGAIELEMQ